MRAQSNLQPPVLRLWFDTEFHDDGERVELISLGIVSSDGREYYAESADYDRRRAHPWLHANVLPLLRPGTERTRVQIANDLRALVGDATPEFWSWFGEYDWIVLRQLFGDLTAWPAGWPLSHMNLEQWRLHLGAAPLVQLPSADLHNALADARWAREAWKGLHDEQVRRANCGAIRPMKTDAR